MLLTKFFLPVLRADRVYRTRLIERLDQAAGCSLVVVSAPAGFGKTTLVSEWVRATQVQTAWLSLDEGDHHPQEFWTDFLSAVERLFPEAGKTSREMLDSNSTPPAQAVLTALLNDLALQGGGQPACLVLDDTHLVTDAAIYDGLLFFIERLPPGLRLVLIGRSDPPLPLGRLRANCRMVEIRAADLRFTLDECEEFLNRVMGFGFSQEHIQQLDERTEGWIAGIQLAGLAMQTLGQRAGNHDLNRFIETFSGNDRYVLDYLMEEVLGRLPAERRDFLLQTSILERLCGPLCDAVTGQPEGESQAVLEACERENLFLVPLDHCREWYRYHHLFADLLRNQLERQGAARNAELHRRAAGWLAGQGLLPEAIRHALKGQDFERAAQWIEIYAKEGIARGEYARLKQWIDALPEAVLYTRPELLVDTAWVLAYLGDVDGYQRPLTAAEALWRAQGNTARLGEAFNLHADFAATGGDAEKAAEYAAQALELLPKEDEYHRGMSWTSTGDAALLAGEMEKAQHAYLMGIAECERSGNTTHVRRAAVSLAQVYQVQGNLPEAARLLEDVIAQTGDQPIHEGLTARTVLSLVRREWNRLDEAESSLRSILETVEKTGQVVYFQQCYLNLALILWEKGDLGGMRSAMEQHARMPRQVEGNGGRVFGYALSALQAALLDDPEAARTWREANPARLHSPVCYADEYNWLIRIRLTMRQGTDAEIRTTLDWLEPLMGLAGAQHRVQSLSNLWMLKALGLARLNDLDGASDALEESLRLACPGGYLRMYLDEGRPLVDLLERLVRKPTFSPELRAYTAQLIGYTQSEADPQTAKTHPANLALIEPLTGREIEVLGMIREGLSNREIAERLYLTVNTVKVHTRNIFGKLDVESRTQAVRRAEELGLI